MSVGVALLGRLAIPAHRCRVVLGTPAGVHDPENVLSVGVALLGKGTPKPQRRRVVALFVGGKPSSNGPAATEPAKLTASMRAATAALKVRFIPIGPPVEPLDETGRKWRPCGGLQQRGGAGRFNCPPRR